MILDREMVTQRIALERLPEGRVRIVGFPAGATIRMINSVDGKDLRITPSGESWLSAPLEAPQNLTFEISLKGFETATQQLSIETGKESLWEVKMKQRSGAFTNSLGMRFVPIPGAGALFSIWETRVQDYAEYAKANPGIKMEWNDYEYKGHKQVPDDPVVNVSWEDALSFCQWLSKKEGRTYRLPTDHEWSCAVGIGDRENPKVSPIEKFMKVSGVYPWGKRWPPPKGAGNYHGQEGAGSWRKIDGFSDPHPFTAPVGSYAANELGIFDLGGNVWEWCDDKWSRTSTSRVLRGASWVDYDSGDLLSSFRYYRDPGYWYRNLGFRVVALAGADG